MTRTEREGEREGRERREREGEESEREGERGEKEKKRGEGERRRDEKGIEEVVRGREEQENKEWLTVVCMLHWVHNIIVINMLFSFSTSRRQNILCNHCQQCSPTLCT